MEDGIATRSVPKLRKYLQTMFRVCKATSTFYILYSTSHQTMNFWHEIAREKIEEKLRSGEWDNLPGKGKPLQLEDDSDVPEHLRLANKVLRDANVTPPWIDELRELDEHRLQVLALRERAFAKARDIRSRNEEISPLLQQWQDAMLKFNKQVTAFEIKAPRGAERPQMFRVRDELQVFARTFGWTMLK